MKLAAFQDAFAAALMPGGAPGAAPQMLARLLAQPGFAVYRNTVLAGCVDALVDNYPAVERIVGSEWLRAAAAVYARSRLPSHPVLSDYGRDFPDFLQAFEPARDLPYLPAVARLDRMWSESHAAAEAPPLPAGWLARRPLQHLQHVVLHVHPAARWCWNDETPVHALWAGNRFDATFTGAALAWVPQGALLTRPGEAVLHRRLSRAGCALLCACAEGAALPQAAAAALASEPEADLASLICDLLEAGAFARPDHPGESR